jgi:hypothetical protein
MKITSVQREWLRRPTLLPPELRQIEGTRRWEFTELYQVSLPPPHFPLRLVIPPGWQYDRSSIPEALPAWIISKDDLGCLAPAAHDAGYCCRGLFRRPESGEIPRAPYIEGGLGPVELQVSRATVDEWFRLYLLRQRVPAWRATAAWWAVRVFGGRW